MPGPRHAAYRIAADVATGGRHVDVYLDLIMQGGGAANAVMLVTSVLDPPPAALESRLATSRLRPLARVADTRIAGPRAGSSGGPLVPSFDPESFEGSLATGSKNA